MADPRGKRILVLGLGATGLSMARWLRAHGARVSLADSRTAPPNVDAVRREFPEMPLDTGPFRCESFAGIDVLAVSPGVPFSTMKHDRPLLPSLEVRAQTTITPA